MTKFHNYTAVFLGLWVLAFAISNLASQVEADANAAQTGSGAPDCSSCSPRDLGGEYYSFGWSLTRLDTYEVVESGSTIRGNEFDRGCCKTGADPSNCTAYNTSHWGDVDMACSSVRTNCRCPNNPVASSGSGSGSRYFSGAGVAAVFGQSGFASLNKGSLNTLLNSSSAQTRFDNK